MTQNITQRIVDAALAYEIDGEINGLLAAIISSICDLDVSVNQLNMQGGQPVAKDREDDI